MFSYATEFGMELCNWNLSSSLREDSSIFFGSNCSRERCFECCASTKSGKAKTTKSGKCKKSKESKSGKIKKDKSGKVRT